MGCWTSVSDLSLSALELRCARMVLEAFGPGLSVSVCPLTAAWPPLRDTMLLVGFAFFFAMVWFRRDELYGAPCPRSSPRKNFKSRISTTIDAFERKVFWEPYYIMLGFLNDSLALPFIILGLNVTTWAVLGLKISMDLDNKLALLMVGIATSLSVLALYTLSNNTIRKGWNKRASQRFKHTVFQGSTGSEDSQSGTPTERRSRRGRGGCWPWPRRRTRRATATGSGRTRSRAAR